MQLDLLFTPIDIGRMTVKNRVVMPAMVTQFASLEGVPTQRSIDYYTARAAGGAGLVIVEATYVHDVGKVDPNQIAIDRDECIPGLRRLASSVQSAGARIAVQLHHAGRATHVVVTGKQLVAPSAISVRGPRNVPRELTIPEIRDLVEAFGEAGRRAKEAGFDAVELHGAHGYLLQQFLSPFANKRTDAYGGSLENRLRCPVEIIRAIKRKAGADFPIIYRMNGEELVDDGLTHEEAKEAARRLAEAGADAIHVSIGTFESSVPTTTPPMEVRQGWITHLAEGIRKSVDVPVITVGRITDPRVAERVLKEGQADLVAIGRGLIADPEWANKAERGAFAEIRRCIGCNEGCVGRIRGSHTITCIYNPEVGRERDSAIRLADRKKRVVVVGGGPAGMEAARVAARRGHDVTLYEQEGYLGGQIALAARIPGRGEFGGLIRYYMAELREAGVKVELGLRATATFVEDLAPDALILSTGITPLMPWTITRWTPEAVTAYDVVAGKQEVGRRALILGGGLIGFDTAVYLADRCKEVRVVEVLAGAEERPLPEANHSMMVFNKLRERGVEVLSCTQVRNARDGVVTVSHEERDDLLRRYPFTRALLERGFREFGEKKDAVIGDFDTLIVALGATPERSVADELRRRIPAVHIIGDAAKPAKALEAIHQGADIGRRI